MFYLLLDPNENCGCIAIDGERPQKFSSEADAIAYAKEECTGERLVLRAVARITDKTTHKVEKLK